MDGRAIFGIQLAYQLDADAVVFSTGASERDGLKEAAYTRREAMKAADRIGESLNIDGAALRDWLEPRVRLDVVSQTTDEELRRNLAWGYIDRGCARFVLVTNRFHAPRVLANALRVREAIGAPHLQVMATAPPDASPLPVIFEPPTRPDRDATDFRPALERIFRIPAERRAAALADIEAAIAKHL